MFEPNAVKRGIPDPLTLLREQHRNALDREMELAIEARSLAARVGDLAKELPTVTMRARLYGALVAALEKSAK